MKLINAGKAVRDLQNNYGVNNAELARRAGTSPQQVIRWRTHKNMKLHTVQIICEAFGVGINEFMLLSLK